MSDLEWKIVGGHLFVRHPECGPQWAAAKANDAAHILQSVIASTKAQCAMVADQHAGKAARERKAKRFGVDVEILAEERGEGIASQQIASAIRSLQITGE